MIVTLQRWVGAFDEQDDVIIPSGYYLTETIRLDRIDKHALEDDEIVLTIGGSEWFYDYDESQYKKIQRYFDNLDVKEN